MPLNGNTFTRLYSWAADAANGIKIRADRMDGDADDIAGGITAVATAINTFLTTASSSAGTTLLNFIQAGVGAVTIPLQTELRSRSITPQQYGALGDGLNDDTSAFAAALATGKDVFVPVGTYKITATLAMSTPNQRLWAAGWGAVLNFALLVVSPGIATSNSTGWQRIENLSLNGISNTSKVISIGSPDVRVRGNWVVNTTAAGHGIYQEDENTGAGTYVFDAVIEHNLVYGVMTAGNYGIRLGTNHQGSKVQLNSVQNWGYLLYINGATTLTTVCFNILQRSDLVGATPAAIAINRTGSGMPLYNVGIEHNYFEQNLVPLYIDDCAPINLTFRKNYCFRNTTSALGSAMYKTGTNTNAAAARIQVYDNYGDGFVNAFSLNNQYAANITKADNNTFVFTAAAYNGATAYVIGNSVSSGGQTYVCIANTTGNAPPNPTFWTPTAYATGSFASSVYVIREHNAFFGNVLTAGAFSSTSVTRMEFATTTANVFVRWDPHEYLESIQVKAVPTGGSPTMTLELHQCTVDTDIVLSTSGSVSATGVITVPVNAYPNPGSHYYLKDAGVGGGGTSYHYVYQFWIR